MDPKTIAEGTATTGTGETAKDSPDQMVSLARVAEMRKEWMAEAQSLFNPDLDRKRNEAIKDATAARKDLLELQERLAEAEEAAKAYEVAKDPEALKRDRLLARRTLEEARAIKATAASERLGVEEERALLRLQKRFGVDDEWVTVRQKAGKTLADMVLEAGEQKFLTDLKTQPKDIDMPAALPGGGGGNTAKQIMDNYIKNPTPANRKAYESVRGS